MRREPCKRSRNFRDDSESVLSVLPAALLQEFSKWVGALIERKVESMMESPATPEAIRLEHNLKIWELAERAGVSQGTISRLERGKIKHIQADTISKIADALGEKPIEYRNAVLFVRDRNKTA